jgi:hypothetical protein
MIRDKREPCPRYTCVPRVCRPLRITQAQVILVDRPRSVK